MSRLASQAVIHTTKGDLKVQLFYKDVVEIIDEDEDEDLDL